MISLKFTSPKLKPAIAFGFRGRLHLVSADQMAMVRSKQTSNLFKLSSKSKYPPHMTSHWGAGEIGGRKYAEYLGMYEFQI